MITNQTLKQRPLKDENTLLKFRALVEMTRRKAANHKPRQLRALHPNLLCDLKLPELSQAKCAKIRILKILETTFTLEFIIKMENIASRMASEGKDSVVLPSTNLIKAILMEDLALHEAQAKKAALSTTGILMTVTKEMAELKKAEDKDPHAVSTLTKALSTKKISEAIAKLEVEKKDTSINAELIKKINQATPTTIKESSTRNIPRIFGLLYKTADQQWRIRQLVNGKQVDMIPDGHYAFVQTKLGFTRITKCPPYSTNHRQTADSAQKIRYAGVIQFAAGKIIYWDNVSGNYQPPLGLEKLVGFPMECFQQYSASNPRSVSPPRQSESPDLNLRDITLKDAKSLPLNSDTPIAPNKAITSPALESTDQSISQLSTALQGCVVSMATSKLTLFFNHHTLVSTINSTLYTPSLTASY